MPIYSYMQCAMQTTASTTCLACKTHKGNHHTNYFLTQKLRSTPNNHQLEELLLLQVQYCNYCFSTRICTALIGRSYQSCTRLHDNSLTCLVNNQELQLEVVCILPRGSLVLQPGASCIYWKDSRLVWAKKTYWLTRTTKIAKNPRPTPRLASYYFWPQQRFHWIFFDQTKLILINILLILNVLIIHLVENDLLGVANDHRQTAPYNQHSEQMLISRIFNKRPYCWISLEIEILVELANTNKQQQQCFWNSFQLESYITPK